MTASTPTPQETAVLELGGSTFVITHDARGYGVHPVCRVHRRVGESSGTLTRAREWQCPACVAEMTKQWDTQRFQQLLPEEAPCLP